MTAEQVLRLALAFLPVLLFLAALRLLDSYKLVPGSKVAAAIVAGALAAIFCYLFNSFVFQQVPAHQDEYARFGAPLVEELAKAGYWVFLILTARVAFMVDAGICGFAVGTGFALVENVFYLRVLEGKGTGIWLVRGFGTAIMHGGVAALGAIVSIYLLERANSTQRRWWDLRLLAPGLLAAMVMHSFFNQGVLSPVASALASVAGLALVLALVFFYSERSLRQWLGGKMDQDIDMLTRIADGAFPQTRQGAYLTSLQNAFSPEVRGDMLSLMHLTIELSVHAKGDLLLREAGLNPAPDPMVESRFKELRYLVKSIGPTGMLAVRPLLAQKPRDLWEMHRLSQTRR